MKLSRMLSMLTGITLAFQLSPAFAATASGKANGAVVPHSTPPNNGLLIRAKNSSEGGSISRSVTLTLPTEVQSDTLKVVVNGKDVTSHFTPANCGSAMCAEGTLSTADGLRGGKNVLYATANKSDGTLASARLRFNGGALQAQARSVSGGTPDSQTAPIVGNSAADNFTPPTVTFNTLTPGGWQGNTAWLQIGSEQLPDSSVSACTSDIYLVVVLDRAALTPVTGQSQCEADASALSTYLKTLTSEEIVIVGTNFQHNADASLDTTAIGGTKYTMQQSSSTYPRGYLAIGAGGAAPGSAYENYYTDSMGTVYPFATGMMIEDAYGNYNFQNALTVEYLVTPNDPANNNQSTVTIFNVGSLFQYNHFSYPDRVVFFSPANQSNGYWLITLQRDNLYFNPICSVTANSAKQETDVQGCGTFYATGASDAATQVTAYTQLASALNALTPDQLAFLVSVGTPAVGANAWDVARTSSAGKYAYYGNFGDALENLGGVPISTLSLYTPGSAYSFVSCTACGNPVTGNSALSTTVYAQQGQTGTLHGILQRNLNGLYWPTRSSQETAGSGAISDFTLDTISGQQPQEWPELSGNLLSGASSVAGQVAAYHYASYQLITGYYIKGAQGDFLDDIHYYFTGSLNTLLDYHTFDPVNLPFPGQPGSCYTWTDPVSNTALSCFTQQDFQALTSQLSTEIVDLVNVLQFMVTGSTNMKDVVATGNGSAALALIGAAASIEGSTLQPPPATPVKTNVSNILNLVSSVVNIGVTVATDGLVPPNLVDSVTRGGSIIGAIFGGASSITGGLTQGGGSSPLPSPQYQFETTIGDLANSSLQQQIAVGFDTELDSILGDWGKLSVLGPLITNTNYPEFYDPNQVAQNAAVTLLGQGSQRDFYIALLPSYYSLQYYPGWMGSSSRPVNPPDMGDVDSGGVCRSWYAWYDGSDNPAVPPYVEKPYPTYGGHTVVWDNFIDDPGDVVDHYIIGGKAQNPGKTGSNGQKIPFIDSQVAIQMFSASELNIPFDEFVTKNGPMSSVFLDTTVNGFDNFPEKQTYACYGYNPDGVGGSTNVTTTTFVAPASAVLGESVVLEATVTTATGPVTSGTVTFDDGTVQIGTGTVDSSGKATFSTSVLALGPHSLAAYFVVNNPYTASQSAVSTLTVYANSPQMTLTLSTRSLNVAYGSTSSPVSLQMVSQAGLAGTVTLSCTGLPAGMTCNFKPAQATIRAGGTASSSFTVSGAAAQAAVVPLAGGITGLLILPLLVAPLWRVRRNDRGIRASLCILLLSLGSIASLVGCGGSSQMASDPETILVNASSGSVTVSVPLLLNVQ